MEVEAVGEQRGADQQEKRERQHLGGRVRLDETADRPGGGKHHDHGDDHGRDHDFELVGEADRGDDGIDGEDEVDHRELDDHRRQR